MIIDTGRDPYQTLSHLYDLAMGEELGYTDKPGYIRPRNDWEKQRVNELDLFTSTVRDAVIAQFDPGDFYPATSWDGTPGNDREIYETICDGIIYTDTEYQRDSLSHLAMKLSLCPLHFVDWAICFDDEDPECSQIREIFPDCHDT